MTCFYRGYRLLSYETRSALLSFGSKMGRATGIIQFIAAKAAGLLITIFIATFLIYGSLYLAPGSAIEYLVGGRSVSPQAIEQLKAQYNLDKPFLVQYGLWISGAIQGDFGRSIVYKQSTQSLIGQLAPTTAFLVIYALILILVVGFLVGILAGLKRGWIDTLVMGGATVLLSVPAFFIGVGLIFWLAVEWDLFPVFGTGTGFVNNLKHMTLPALSLALGGFGFVARMTRTFVREQADADHVKTAVSRGLPRGRIIRRHIVRNAAVPLVTVGGVTTAVLLAGTVVIEQLFQLNGLGYYLVQSVQSRDFPMVQAICTLYMVVILVMNTIIDITYGLLDPRIAQQSAVSR